MCWSIMPGISGAPVVCEDAPTYRNLFGTIERWIDPMGRSATNFMRIIPGLLPEGARRLPGLRS